MEPRSLERGNAQAEVGYQGGEFKLQWSHVHSNVETLRRGHARAQLRGFNGATFTRTWKQDHVKSAWFGGNSLQWSHVHSNVETGRGLATARTHVHASMEPRSLERGNADQCGKGSLHRTGFNGATFTRTWKRHVHAQQDGARQASMEPRSLERGNVLVHGVEADRKRLQWSHVHSNVET